MSEHSPGPWMVVRDGGYVYVRCGGHASLAMVLDVGPERMANARLIADAPTTAAERDELLAALERRLAMPVQPEHVRLQDEALVARVRERIDGRAVTGEKETL